MSPLHHQAQAFVEQLAVDNPPAWSELPLHVARDAFNTFGEPAMAGTGPELASVEDRRIAGDIPVRIYRPSNDANLTPVMYFHGGGWVLGNVGTHDTLCRSISSESGAVVISVDYRLAPEHRFPAPLDDCYAATVFIAENADEFGVDRARLVVAGDSAGGNLAAAVSLRARDEDGPRIARQILIYPVVTPDFSTRSYAKYAEGYGLTRDTMIFFWECYLGKDLSNRSPLADLSKQKNFSGLPQAHVFLASHDVLHDEGMTLATHMADAGVTTTVKTYPGTLHGFVHFAGLFDDGVEATNDIATTIRNDHK